MCNTPQNIWLSFEEHLHFRNRLQEGVIGQISQHWAPKTIPSEIFSHDLRNILQQKFYIRRPNLVQGYSATLGNTNRELTEINTLKTAACVCKLMRKHVGKNSVNRQVNSSEKLSDPVRSPVCDKYTHIHAQGQRDCTLRTKGVCWRDDGQSGQPWSGHWLTIGASREINRGWQAKARVGIRPPIHRTSIESNDSHSAPWQ